MTYKESIEFKAEIIENYNNVAENYKPKSDITSKKRSITKS